MPSQNGMEGVQQRRTESFEVIIFHRGEASLKAATVVGTIYGQFIRYLSLREYVDRITRKKFIAQQKFSRSQVFPLGSSDRVRAPRIQ
jgi:hypothetical protein